MLSEDAKDAAEAWLTGLDPVIHKRGSQLAKAGAVEDWVWDEKPEGLWAIVQGGSEYEVTILFKKGRFQRSVCTCPYASNCKHAAAAMLVALQDSNESLIEEKKVARKAGGDPSRNTLVEEAGTRSGRKLPAQVKKALTKIENWWSAGKHRVWKSELLGLIGVSAGWSMEAIELHGKRVAPKDAWDYLACVEAHLAELGFGLPHPIPDLIDRTRQTELLTEQREEREELKWKETIKFWASSLLDVEKSSGLTPELRVRLQDKGAVIEMRKPGQADFTKATASALKNMPHTGGRLANDTILSHAREEWGAIRVEFQATDEELGDLLLPFITYPQLRPALVGPAGEAVIFHEEPLTWAVDESSARAYTLHLCKSDGTVPPEPLMVICHAKSWFVTGGEIWPLECWPFGEDGAGARMTIPASALETGEGVSVLRKLGLPMPSRIQSRIRTINAAVTIRAGVGQPNGASSSSLMVSALATFEDGSKVERLESSGWVPLRPQAEKAETEGIVTFDRSSMGRAAAWIYAMDLKFQTSWRTQDVWWERRITKDFPDQFLQWMAVRPEDVVVELDGELASLRNGVVSASVRLDVEEAGMDWFDLRVALAVEDTTLTNEEIQLLLKAQGRWVRIAGKGWRKLHFEMTPEQEAELAAMGLTVADFDGSAQRLHALQLASGAGKSDSLLPAERAEAVRRRSEEIRTRVQPEVPPFITAQLRPYQMEGFHFLAYLSANRFGGVLADDMGLGKTVQSLTWLAWLREAEQAREPASKPAPVLVVCPKSVQDNWRSETQRFWPDLRVVVWSRDMAGKSGLDGEADLVVIHYQQLRQHEEALTKHRWLAVILDEAQAIKNPTSQSAKAACALQAGHRLALTGTPVENRLLDLWSILSFAMPGILGNRAHFAKHFDGKEDPLARRRLAARVRPFLLRRTKKEVAKDLPDRVEEDLVCELEGPQRALYLAELKRARAALLDIKTPKQLDKARFNILTSLLRLRQICCHPALVIKDAAFPSSSKGAKSRTTKGGLAKVEPTGSETGSAKLDALMELLEPIMDEGGKVLVFSQFVEMLNLIQEQLVAREWTHSLLTGQTEDRGALVKGFQECAGPAVFLISLKAGGSGLNLTAASYVVLCDPWWNPAVEAQAIDRTHRIGQTQKVNAYRLIVKDSIEEKIRLLQKQKSALAQDILGEENFASALSLDDFRFLLGEE